MTHRLSLRRETLAPLTPDELAGVVGAALPTTPVTRCALIDFSRGHTCVNC